MPVTQRMQELCKRMKITAPKIELEMSSEPGLVGLGYWNGRPEFGARRLPHARQPRRRDQHLGQEGGQGPHDPGRGRPPRDHGEGTPRPDRPGAGEVVYGFLGRAHGGGR